MEVVNQIVAFFTPYLGEYARYVPIVIGTLLAVIAFVIRRRFVNKMNADIAIAKQKDAAANETSPESAASDSTVPDTSSADEVNLAVDVESQDPVVDHASSPLPALSWSERIKSGLSRTRNGLGSGLSAVIGGHKKVDDNLLEALETQLLMADVGIDATQTLISGLTDKLNRKELSDSTALLTHLKADMGRILSQSQQALDLVSQDGPFVILMVGVNGVGKTTTIGKLAKKYQAEGKSVMLAAGDTFRAAAVEQLQVWGERNNVPVVAQHTGADSASVIYDAIESAKAKGIDIVIADTAGRLQNKANLMNELSKVVRVMKKLDENAPHEVMLVLDAGTGQNAISQAKLFSEAVGVSGITLTKLDGTAKGGIIFAIAKQFGLPIRYIGVGEQADDLRPFVAEEFVDALFDSE
ncbi:signal recognition particle-docking protein FtsY [Marinomonas sp. M1K-6]|uniref:Signal recognition particle receptor FtsY n=1 Tax=Marinomonas profundi TaxID=2726122 RepID=A0A847R7Z3_9GAMM|nr:signal recognition particle-docking protein FtsY [Marinomonas profundi]NLQ17267.1 signal recognition particle-docking protein FtsY [Marinomonas profundi]UDV04544.1 signal recognition particle-docking protein FtsY [Marinomonas profundi]